MASHSPISAVLPLASEQAETPVAAIAVDHPAIDNVDQDGLVVSAKKKKQLHKRELANCLLSEFVTDEEALAVADKPHRRIKRVQVDHVGPNNSDGMDNHPVPPGWVQTILDRLDAQDQQQKELHTLSRQILQQNQRFINGSVRTTMEPLVPVLRMEDGQVPFGNGFPPTVLSLYCAKEPQIDLLLQFYSLDPNGNTGEKKKRLRDHLGITM